MSGTPSKEAKVPAAAANYTPGTIDAELRSSINHLLLEGGYAAKIQEQLLHALNSNTHNWPTAVQNHAAKLLRDNEVDTFPALLRRVLEDVRRDQQLFSSSSANGADGKDKDKDKPNGDKKGAVNGAGAGGGEKPALAIPNAVVEEALKATMESLKEIVTLED